MSRLFEFGKYRGCSVENVITSNPSYAIWAHWNVSFFKLTNEELHAAETAIHMKRQCFSRRHNWHFDEDDDWDSWW